MRVIAALCLVVVLASCGVDSQRNAHVFDASEVPYGLANTTPPPTTTAPPVAGFAPFTAAATPSTVAYDLYFVRANVLVAVTRRATTLLTPADLVMTLVAGPTPSEVTTGHRSAITGPEAVAHTRENASIVTVDLAKTFNEIPRSDRIFALGQITLTLTAGTGIALVQYTVADVPIEVPKANGVVTRDPVTRSDYTTLLLAPASSPNNAASTPTASTAPSTSAPSADAPSAGATTGPSTTR